MYDVSDFCTGIKFFSLFLASGVLTFVTDRLEKKRTDGDRLGGRHREGKSENVGL